LTSWTTLKRRHRPRVLPSCDESGQIVSGKHPVADYSSRSHKGEGWVPTADSRSKMIGLSSLKE
jgi:hypothetical protein